MLKVIDRYAAAFFTLTSAIQLPHSLAPSRVRQKRIVFPETRGSPPAPWFATVIKYNSDYDRWVVSCGATIMSDSIVMTAAHCICGRPLEGIRIHVGLKESGKVHTNQQSRQIIAVSANADFDPKTFVHDIALVGLRTPLNMSGLLPAKLPPADTEPMDGTLCKYDGWGLAEGGMTQLVSAVSKTTLKTISQSRCYGAEQKKNPDTSLHKFAGMLCTMTNFTAISLGDSGGPLNCPDPTSATGQMVVSGVACSVCAEMVAAHVSTTSMEKEAIRNNMAFFVSVASHRHWIESEIRHLEDFVGLLAHQVLPNQEVLEVHAPIPLKHCPPKPPDQLFHEQQLQNIPEGEAEEYSEYGLPHDTGGDMAQHGHNPPGIENLPVPSGMEAGDQPEQPGQPKLKPQLPRRGNNSNLRSRIPRIKMHPREPFRRKPMSPIPHGEFEKHSPDGITQEVSSQLVHHGNRPQAFQALPGPSGKAPVDKAEQSSQPKLKAQLPQSDNNKVRSRIPRITVHSSEPFRRKPMPHITHGESEKHSPNGISQEVSSQRVAKMSNETTFPVSSRLVS